MGPRDRLPARHDAFSSAHLAQPSYTTRSGRHAGDFKTACTHGRIQYCNTTFYRIAPLVFFFCCPVALWFLRAPFRSRTTAKVIFPPHHRSITPPTKPIVTPMSVAKTFSRTARKGEGPWSAVVCEDMSQSRVAYVQMEGRESNLTAILFSLRELGST